MSRINRLGNAPPGSATGQTADSVTAWRNKLVDLALDILDSLGIEIADNRLASLINTADLLCKGDAFIFEEKFTELASEWISRPQSELDKYMGDTMVTKRRPAPPAPANDDAVDSDPMAEQIEQLKAANEQLTSDLIAASQANMRLESLLENVGQSEENAILPDKDFQHTEARSIAWTDIIVGNVPINLTTREGQTAEGVYQTIRAHLDALGLVYNDPKIKKLAVCSRNGAVEWLKGGEPPNKPMSKPEEKPAPTTRPPQKPADNGNKSGALTEPIVKIARGWNDVQKYQYTGLYTNFGNAPGKFPTFTIKDDNETMLDRLFVLTDTDWVNAPLGTEMGIDLTATYVLSERKNSRGEPYKNLVSLD